MCVEYFFVDLILGCREQGLIGLIKYQKIHDYHPVSGVIKQQEQQQQQQEEEKNKKKTIRIKIKYTNHYIVSERINNSFE